MTSQLLLYNNALKILGEPKLTSLTEEREPRRALDDVYNSALGLCLEAGQWWFATREAEIFSSATPAFGFTYSHAKPSDWVRTMALSADEFFAVPLLYGSDQPDNWYSEIDPLYVRYVSNDTSFGLDLVRWPQSFAEYVEHELAERICKQITQDKALHDRIRERSLPKAKKNALSKDAMNDIQPKFKPAGQLVRSRQAGESHRAGVFIAGIYNR